MLRTSIPSTTSTLPAMMVSEPRARDLGQAALMADYRSIGKDHAGPLARSGALSLDTHTTSPAGLKVLTASACPRGQPQSVPVGAHPGPTRCRIVLGSSTRCAESPPVEVHQRDGRPTRDCARAKWSFVFTVKVNRATLYEYIRLQLRGPSVHATQEPKSYQMQ